MKLMKLLSITKSTNFTIFTAADEKGTLPQVVLKITREEDGTLPEEIGDFADAQVKEIIPKRGSVNVVVEMKTCDALSAHGKKKKSQERKEEEIEKTELDENKKGLDQDAGTAED